MGRQHHDANDGRNVLCRRCLSLQQKRSLRALPLWRLRVTYVFGNTPDPRRLRAERRRDECGWLMDGNDELGQLDSQRDPAYVRADATCGDGAAHGRGRFGDLSGLDLDQEVYRCDWGLDGVGHGP